MDRVPLRVRERCEGEAVRRWPIHAVAEALLIVRTHSEEIAALTANVCEPFLQPTELHHAVYSAKCPEEDKDCRLTTKVSERDGFTLRVQ